MRECVIVGRPNAGKTLFALNFAAFLGNKNVTVTCRTPANIITCHHLRIDNAKKELCSAAPYKTRQIQSLVLNMPIEKAQVSFKLSDTCGLTSEINSDAAIRSSMAQTISQLQHADLILHIIDGSISLTNGGNFAAHRIDQELYQYGISRQKYILLMNKLDVPIAFAQVKQLKEIFSKAHFIPISALYQQGFREVRACVARNI